VEDYKPNSHKSREVQKDKPVEERKKVDKVVTGIVKTKKKSEIRKFTDVFISEDISNVKSYLLTDVLVPAIKKLVIDTVTDGINMILNGGTGRGHRGTNASYVSYRQYSDQRDSNRHGNESRGRSGYNYDDIILESRGEAEDVLSRMDELIDIYGTVSVADMYDLVGKTCNYTDNKYGWTNIRNAEPIRVRDGYMLKLPKALPIN
jgi:hypothetical protein